MTARPRRAGDEGRLSEISGLVLAEETVSSVLDRVVAVAVAGVAGVDEASVSLLHGGPGGGRFRTVSASSDRVREVDESQYRSLAGPGIDAMRSGVEIAATLNGRWPSFTADAGAVGIRAAWSLPLRVGDATIGALNLYSYGRPLWDERAGVLARALADQAAVVLANVAALSEAELANRALRRALRTQELIGQAEGILMARQHIDGDAAFDVLRRASQRTNRKLRDLAAEIVDSVSRPAPGPPAGA